MQVWYIGVIEKFSFVFALEILLSFLLHLSAPVPALTSYAGIGADFGEHYDTRAKAPLPT